MREAIFDNKNLEPVPVIASFSADGEIKPLYVRLQNMSLKILRVRAGILGYLYPR